MRMVRMERHKCKLCSRSFSSGRALGGHMRSHLANLPLPPKTPQKQEERQPPVAAVVGGGGAHSTESSTSAECSSGEEKENSTFSSNEDQKGVAYGLRGNPKKSFRSADPRQSLDTGGDGGLAVVVQDGESEAESTKKPTRRRSKRTRRMLVQQPSSTESMAAELEQVSSVSNTNSPEEDLAMCLIMLSRDVWSSTTSIASEEYSQSQPQELKPKPKPMSNKSCKKMKIHCWEDNDDEEGELEEVPRNVVCRRIKNGVDKKVHECPFCGKIFGSGQALGGHKRSHFLGSTTTTTTTTTTTITTTASVSNLANKLAAAADTEILLVPTSSKHGGMLLIDLNLPAPMEEEEEELVEDDDDDDHLGRKEQLLMQQQVS